MSRHLWILVPIGLLGFAMLAGCSGQGAPPDVPAKKFPGQVAPSADRGGPAVPPKPGG